MSFLRLDLTSSPSLPSSETGSFVSVSELSLSDTESPVADSAEQKQINEMVQKLLETCVMGQTLHVSAAVYQIEKNRDFDVQEIIREVREVLPLTLDRKALRAAYKKFKEENGIQHVVSKESFRRMGDVLVCHGVNYAPASPTAKSSSPERRFG